MSLKTRSASANQRARELGLTYNLHKDDIVFALNFFEYRCAYCDCELDVNFNCDHIVPISEEDDNTINFGSVAYNIVCVCETCNYSKGTQELNTWLAKIFPNSEEIKYRINEYQIMSGINEILW